MSKLKFLFNCQDLSSKILVFAEFPKSFCCYLTNVLDRTKINFRDCRLVVVKVLSKFVEKQLAGLASLREHRSFK